MPSNPRLDVRMLRCLKCATGVVAALLAALLWSPSAWALDVISVPAGFSSQKLVSDIEVLEDPNHVLSVQDLASGRHDAQFRSPTADPSYGLSRSAFWVRMKLQQAPEVRGTLLLEVVYATLDHVDLFIPESTAPGGFAVRRSGDSREFDTRDVPFRNVVFRVPPGGNEPLTLYLRIASGNAVAFPLKLWSARQFNTAVQQELLLYGAFFGTLAGLALYNLFLFFTIRDSAYLYYVLFTTCLGMSIAGYSGLGFQYVWPRQFNDWGVVTFLCLAGASWLMFQRAFMTSKEETPRLNRALLWAAWLNLAGFALSAPAGYRIASAVGFAFILVDIGILALTCFIQWRRKFRAVRFFLVAFGIDLITGIAIMLSSLGIVPLGFLNLYGVQSGGVVDTILLALALADRINILKRDKELAQAEALRNQQIALEAAQQAERELEVRVQKRTSELREMATQMEAMALRDALTGVANRRAFNERIVEELARVNRDGQPLALLMLDVDHFKSINDRYGHLTGDECLRRIGAVLDDFPKRVNDFVARFGGEEFAILLPGTDMEAAALMAEKVRCAVGGIVLEVEGLRHPVTVSIGLTVCIPVASSDVSQFIARADAGLYVAKQQGRNRIACIDSANQPFDQERSA